MEAQRTAVSTLVGNGIIIREYAAVGSGKVKQRPHLDAAIQFAKEKSASLVIAKLDRLSGNAGLIFILKDSVVDFQCAGMP